MRRETRKEKKAYEAPAFRVVTLKIAASLLGGCQTNSTDAIFSTCKTVSCQMIK